MFGRPAVWALRQLNVIDGFSGQRSDPYCSCPSAAGLNMRPLRAARLMEPLPTVQRPGAAGFNMRLRRSDGRITGAWRAAIGISIIHRPTFHSR